MMISDRPAMTVLALLALGATFVLPFNLWAADGDHEGTDIVVWEDALGRPVAEILVQARRRTESLQEVPLSITALTDGWLRDWGGGGG